MATNVKKVELEAQGVEETTITEAEVSVEEKSSKVKEKLHAAGEWVSARKKKVLTGVGVAVAVVGAGVAAAVINAKASETGDPTIGERIAEAVEDVTPTEI